MNRNKAKVEKNEEKQQIKIINRLKKRKSKLFDFRIKLLELFILTITADIFILGFMRTSLIYFSVLILVGAAIELLTAIYNDSKRLNENELKEKLKNDRELTNIIDIRLEKSDYISIILYTLSLIILVFPIAILGSTEVLTFIGPEFVCPDFHNNSASINISFANYNDYPMSMSFEWKGDNVQGYSNYFESIKRNGYQPKFRISIPYMPRKLQSTEYTTFDVVMKVNDSNQTFANFSINAPISNTIFGNWLLDIGDIGIPGTYYGCNCINKGNGFYVCEKR
jgi:hypothetical protein